MALHKSPAYDPQPCMVAIDPNDPYDAPTYPGWEDGSVVNSWPVVYVQRSTLDHIVLDMVAEAGISLEELCDPNGYDMGSIVQPTTPARTLPDGTGLYSLVGLTTTLVATADCPMQHHPFTPSADVVGLCAYDLARPEHHHEQH